MKFGELFELLITLLIFLVIWILPRIMAARAADRKRRKRSGVKAASKESPEAVPKSAPEPKQSWSKEIFSKLIDDTFLDTEKKEAPAQTEKAAPQKPTEPVSVFEDEKMESEEPEPEAFESSELDYQWNQRKRSLSDLKPVPPKAVSSQRIHTPLQKAVIWKELLDPPKALRREPFP